MTRTTPPLRTPDVRPLLALAVAALLWPGGARSQTLQKTAVTVDANGNGFFDVDETVQYTLTFRNTTTADLAEVVLRDESSGCLDLDIGSLTIDPPEGSTDNSSGNAIDVALPVLAPGQSVTLSFYGIARATGECCNQATWSSPTSGGVSDLRPGDSTPGQPTCHVTQNDVNLDYDAVVDKQVLTSGCLAPGSVVEFRVTVRNSGRRPLRDGRFEDVLSAGFTDPQVDGGLSWDPATRTIASDSGTWGVGQEVSYTYRATLPCTSSGTLFNTATFSFAENNGTSHVRSDSESVTWGEPDFASSRMTWADDPLSNDGVVDPGEDVRFTIVVDNGGGCRGRGVQVIDDLDPRFLSDPGVLVIDEGGLYDPDTRTITWNEETTPALRSLDDGGSVTLGFTTRIDPATPAGALIPNTVRIVSGGTDTRCPDLPATTRTVALQNGSVVWGLVEPTTILLRNDGIACLADALATMRGEGGRTPILRVRPEPQECSNPPAINPDHERTSVVLDPVVPHVFEGDAAWVGERCPEPGAGAGRVLIFYELQDECTTSLRVRKSLTNPADVVITW